MNHPFFSIIIPTKNESHNIRECLTSIFKQKIKDAQIILADNGSDDSTVKIVEQKFPEVKIIIHPNISVSDLRRLAVEQADGEYLFFIDADQVLSINLLEECQNLIQSKHLDALSVAERPYKRISFLQKVIGYERELMEKAGRALPRIYKKSFYHQIKGHRQNLVMGEDKTLLDDAKKQNIKMDITKNYIFHKDFEHLLPLLKKYVKYGKSMHYLEDKNTVYTDKAGTFILELIRLAILRFNPIMAMSIFILKILKMLMLKLGEKISRKRSSIIYPQSRRKKIQKNKSV